MSGVGINLSQVSYWGSQYPFIDRMKSAGWWTAVSTDGKSSTLTTIDANGYPTGVPTGTSYLYTSVALDPVELAMTDRYVITYEGTAKVQPLGVTIISSEPGRIVFEAPKSRIQLKVTGLDPAKPLGALSIVREDQVDAFKKGEIFNPDFVSKIDPFSTLRFMDWGATNNSTLTSWNDRPTMSDRTWAGSEGGVPVEVMVALANQTKNNMWINIPAAADDTYVRNTLQYIKDNLDPTLKVKVEYSNEMWNFVFKQAGYALDQGDKLWGKDANGDGKIDPNDPKEHVGDGYLQYYGYRAAQVASIAKQVFGAQSDARLENVLANQQTGSIPSIVNGVAKAGVGSVGALFDDYAITTYFGNLGQGSKDDLATLMQWARSGSAGVDAAFAELAHGGTLSKTISIDDLADKLTRQGDAAAALGLNLVTYEGGADMTATRLPEADQADLVAFYNRLVSDPRMGSLYRDMQTLFNAAGGVELNAFNDVGAASKYGSWGALTSIYDQGSVRYDTLVALAKEQAAIASAPSLLKTNAAVYTLSATQTDMTYTGTGTTTITGNALTNRLTAGSGGGVLYGLDGDDRLIGSTGADRLDGGKGADTMTGGAGDDTYVVDDVNDKVVEQAGGGTDEVRTTLIKYNLGNNVENLTYTGSNDFRGTGNELANTIVGGVGNDTLNGAAGDDRLYGGDGDDIFSDTGGADLMVGGRGDDTYSVDNIGDTIVEAAGEGYDTVYSKISFSLVGNSLEALRAKGTDAINLTGNELDNMLVGNDAANTLRGNAGADSLKGAGGNDLLYGDAGTDTLDGGDGDDKLYGGDGNDRLIGGDGNDLLVGGPGTDRMTGGAGNDTFAFLSLADMGNTRSVADTIDDFATGDRIDLSAIDAKKGTATNDAFTFIGASNFSKKAGELRAANVSGRWEITGDIDGDGVADFMVVANKASAFVKTDFVL